MFKERLQANCFYLRKLKWKSPLTRRAEDLERVRQLKLVNYFKGKNRWSSFLQGFNNFYKLKAWRLNFSSKHRMACQVNEIIEAHVRMNRAQVLFRLNKPFFLQIAKSTLWKLSRKLIRIWCDLQVFLRLNGQWKGCWNSLILNYFVQLVFLFFFWQDNEWYNFVFHLCENFFKNVFVGWCWWVSWHYERWNDA